MILLKLNGCKVDFHVKENTYFSHLHILIGNWICRKDRDRQKNKVPKLCIDCMLSRESNGLFCGKAICEHVF